jgi:hypothetical protein
VAEQLDPGSGSGGILRLLEIRDQHPAELAYDFRSRFNLSYLDIGDTVTYLETVQLVSILVKDPTSWLASVLYDWKQPVSREWAVLADVYDLLAMVNSKKKPKPFPRPWPTDGEGHIGRANQNPAEVKRRLELMNPKEKPDGR